MDGEFRLTQQINNSIRILAGFDLGTKSNKKKSKKMLYWAYRIYNFPLQYPETTSCDFGIYVFIDLLAVICDENDIDKETSIISCAGAY